jgi:hypothetical protein
MVKLACKHLDPSIRLTVNHKNYCQNILQDLLRLVFTYDDPETGPYREAIVWGLGFMQPTEVMASVGQTRSTMSIHAICWALLHCELKGDIAPTTNIQLQLQSYPHHKVDRPTSQPNHPPGSRQMRSKLLEPAGHLSAVPGLQSCHHHEVEGPKSQPAPLTPMQQMHLN